MEFNGETELLITDEVLASAFLTNPPTKTEAELRGYARAIAQFVNNAEEVEWLFTKIRGGCTFFPKPIEARIIHNRKYNAADGMRPDDSDKGVDMREVVRG